MTSGDKKRVDAFELWCYRRLLLKGVMDGEENEQMGVGEDCVCFDVEKEYGPFLLKLLVTVKIMCKKKFFKMCNKCCQGCSGEH